MKKWLLFGGGVLTGIIVTFMFLYFLGKAPEYDNVKMFEKPGDKVEVKSFEVFQVLDNGAALVHGEDDGYYSGKVYLLIDNEGRYYTDDEIIEVPENKVVRKIGVYRYMSKTVSIIEIMDE